MIPIYTLAQLSASYRIILIILQMFILPKPFHRVNSGCGLLFLPPFSLGGPAFWQSLHCCSRENFALLGTCLRDHTCGLWWVTPVTPWAWHYRKQTKVRTWETELCKFIFVHQNVLHFPSIPIAVFVTQAISSLSFHVLHDETDRCIAVSRKLCLALECKQMHAHSRLNLSGYTGGTVTQSRPSTGTVCAAVCHLFTESIKWKSFWVVSFQAESIYIICDDYSRKGWFIINIQNAFKCIS